jgi:hypothetical protein
VIVIEDQVRKEAPANAKVLESVLPVIQCPVHLGDAYKLFGGTRIERDKLNLPAQGDDTSGYSCMRPYYVNNTDVVLEFPFNYSLRSEKLAYLRTSQVNNNIATTSFLASNRNEDKVGLESTQLMAAIPLQDEYLYYQAPTDHNFFVNFTSKQATLLEFSIVDSCGRQFPYMGVHQGSNGNRSFELIVRVDRIKRTEEHPEQFSTNPPAKSTAPRMANAPTQWMSRGIPGYGLNMPGQVLGDGYKPMFEK